MPDKTLPKNPIFKKTSKQSAGETAEQQDVQPVGRVKATFYLEIDDIEAIDDLQLAELRRTGKKPEKSQIVSRAIKRLKEAS